MNDSHSERLTFWTSVLILLIGMVLGYLAGAADKAGIPL